MRRNFMKVAALALAGLFGMNKQAMSQAGIETETAKVQGQHLGAARYLHGNPMGGLNAGSGRGNKKSNRNRYSHNAKLKRRMA